MADNPESLNIKARPNIRIEIHNNIMDSISMEVDEVTTKLSDGEEGEILEEASGFDDFIDNNITYPKRPMPEQQKKPWVSVSSKGFPTGINIFDKEEQEKLSERAKRFAIDPNEVTNFTDEDLQSLKDSLGITSEGEKEVRFEALHIHGTNEMSSDDVLSYFEKYSPSSIEWITDDCCNVVWEDKITSARALFYLSKLIKGMPVEGPCDPFAPGFNKEGSEEIGKSILLKNNNREIQLEDETMEKDNDEISVSDITVPIPPGYWRLGVPHVKSKCVLIRFAMKSDKKPFKAEKFSEYYKKYGNPNYGGLKGIISESKKAQFRSIFERNKEIKGKNPWGDLAKTWSKDKRTEEIVQPVVEVAQPNPKLKHRLGFKRGKNDEGEEKPEKSKVPRMRMYADEEEERIKRKKELDAIKKIVNAQIVQKSEQNDLRNVIRKRDLIKDTNTDEEVSEPEAQVDLGSILMNRRLKFIPNPNTNSFDKSITNSKRSETTDVRKRIEQRAVENMTKQHRFREELLKNKRYKSPPPPPTSRNRSTNKNKYTNYSDHDEDETVEDEDEEMYYSDEDSEMKTNSKVTVVIKKHKQPTVASTVWSRVNTTANVNNQRKAGSVKERLHMSRTNEQEGRMGRMRSRTKRDSNSSTSDDSSDSDGNSETSGDEDNEKEDTIKPCIVARPGFRSDLSAEYKAGDHKSPLRIEINNDHFQK